MVILIASQFGFALNNNRSYISSTNFLSYRLIKYYRGKHCGKYSSGHEAVSKITDTTSYLGFVFSCSLYS